MFDFHLKGITSKTMSFQKFFEFYKNISNDRMSGDEISVLMKKFEKLSSVACGWKNIVYNGTPCSFQALWPTIFVKFRNDRIKIVDGKFKV